MLRLDVSDLADRLNIGDHDGWEGSFTRNQADGAMPNGSRVAKTSSEPGDSTPDGTLGTVLGSIAIPRNVAAEHRLGYFVEWEKYPRRAVFVLAYKVRVTAG